MIDVERIVADALALAATPAPTGHEETRARAVAALLREVRGLEVRDDAAGNVWGRIVVPASEHGAETAAVVVTAHLDTVFGPEVDVRPRRVHSSTGDTLHGPGIGDNAIALASLVALARELMELSPRVSLSRDIVLAATVGEEGLGNLRGVRALLQNVAAACVIALEGHGRDRIVTRAVGSVRLGVAYEGPGGHSWQDRGAPSAVHALARAAARVVDEVRAAVPECAVNVGVFHGGSSVNTIAAHAEFQLDLRAVSPPALAAGERVAREVMGQVAAESGVAATITEIGRRPAGALPDDHALVEIAQQARVAAGLPPAALSDGSTDANAAWEIDVPGIAIGLTAGGGMHRLDEYVEVAPLGRGIAAALGLIQRASLLD